MFVKGKSLVVVVVTVSQNAGVPGGEKINFPHDQNVCHSLTTLKKGALEGSQMDGWPRP